MILHKRTRHDCTFASQQRKSKKMEHFLEHISWQWFEHDTVSIDLRVIANTPGLDNRQIAANGQFTTDSPHRSVTLIIRVYHTHLVKSPYPETDSGLLPGRLKCNAP